jgi:hypothetical protein
MTQPSLAEISVVLLSQAVYRSTSALKISERDEPILIKFSPINLYVFFLYPSKLKKVATEINAKIKI